MIGELFKRFVGSAEGYENRTKTSGAAPPKSPQIKTLVANDDEDRSNMYLKIECGKVVGWRRIN